MHHVLHNRLIWPSSELVAKKVRLLYFTKKKSERLRCLEDIKLQDRLSSSSVMYDKLSLYIIDVHFWFCTWRAKNSASCLNHVLKKYLHWFYTLMKATWLVHGVDNSRHCGRCRDSSILLLRRRHQSEFERKGKRISLLARVFWVRMEIHAKDV